MGRFVVLLLLLSAVYIPKISHGSTGDLKCRQGSNQTAFPLSEVRYEALNSSRRKLGDFRECAPCTCCTDETRRYCFLTGCCYSINCSLRRVPFGLCSFTPVSCNCFGCG